MIEVEAPDGSIVEFPDGMAPAAMAGAMQKRFGVQKPAQADPSAAAAAPAAPTAQNMPAGSAAEAKPNPNLSRVGAQDWDMGSEVLNGMTLGALPNLQAGVLAGVRGLKNAIGYDGPTVSDTYDSELQKAQDARREYRATFPWTALAADTAGGVATGAGLAGKGVTLVGRELPAAIQRIFGTVAPKIAAGGVEGAAYGGASGFLGGEGGVDQRVANAKANIPAGFALGAVAPPIVDYVAKPAASMLGNMYRGLTDQEGQGKQLLVKAIMRDRQTPEDLAQAVETAQGAGQPDFAPVDAGGRNTQRLFKMATRTPGEFREDAAHTLDARQSGQTDRLQGYVDQATGNVGPNARQIERGITDARAAQSEPLYEKAYAQPAPQGAFYDDMLQRQSVQDAMRGVKDIAAEKQMPISDLFTEVPTPAEQQVTKQVASKVLGPDGQPIMQTVVENPTTTIPTMRGWDMVKRNLDTQVDAGFRSTDAQQRAGAQAIKETRDQLRGQLGADNPHYQKALDNYSDKSSALDAVQTGRDLVKSPSDATREAFDEIPAGQRDLARVGGAAEIKNKLSSQTGSGIDRTKMFDSGNMRENLDRLAVSPEARETIGNAGLGPTRSGQLGREQQMAGTRRLVAGGSDTVENLLEEPPAGIMQALGLALSGHPIRGAGMGLEVARRVGSGLGEGGASTVGNYLLNKNPAEIRALADLFANAQAIASRPSTAPAIFSAGVNAGRQRSNNRYAVER